MTRRPRWRRLLWGLPAIGIIVLGLALYQVTQHVPRFYREALVADQEVHKQACDQVLRRISTLSNDLRNGRPWQLQLSAEEINGWLAVDLPRNYPDALPPEAETPRVAIDGNLVRVAVRVRRGGFRTVVSLVLEPYLSKPDEVAVRIRSLRAGGLPIPFGQILDNFSETIQQSGLKLQWRQTDGDPVAVISVVARNTGRGQIHLAKFQLADGKVLVSGTSTRH